MRPGVVGDVLTAVSARALVAAETSVVGVKDDDGFFFQLQLFELSQDSPDTRIEFRQHGCIFRVVVAANAGPVLKLCDQSGGRPNRRVHGMVGDVGKEGGVRHVPRRSSACR